jgi:hypothetical protein
MAVEPFDIIVGVGNVYIAAVGTAFPDTDETPTSSWTYLGATDDDGVTVNHVRERDLHYKGTSALPQKATLNTAREEISFNLCEITPERYAAVLDNMSVVTVAAGSGTPGTRYFNIEPTDVQFALLLRGPSPLSNAYAQYEYVRVTPVDGSELQLQKGDKTVLSVMFQALESTTNAGRFGTYRAQAAAALP